MKTGTLVFDTRDPNMRGTFVRLSKCGKFGVVKFPGKHSVNIPKDRLRRVLYATAFGIEPGPRKMWPAE